MASTCRHSVHKIVSSVCRLQAKLDTCRAVTFHTKPTKETETSIVSSSLTQHGHKYSTSIQRTFDMPDLITANNEVMSPYGDLDIPDVSIMDFCFDKMQQHSQHIGMVDTDTGAKYTWGDLRDNVRRVASGLTKMGYKKGDVICIFMTNTPDFTIMFLAISAIGGIITTANPQYHAGELRTQLVDSRAKAVFMRASDGDVVKEAARGLPHVKELISLGECTNCTNFNRFLHDNGRTFPDNVHINPSEDVAVIPYSSGTTGLPKGVMLTHKNIVSNIHQCGGVLPLNENDRNLCVLPLYHIYGLVFIQFSALRDGWSMYTMSSFEPKKFLQHMHDKKITILNAVPPMVLLMAKHPAVDDYDLSHLRLLMVGAAPLGDDLTREFLDKFPKTDVIQGFGMTELSPVAIADVPPGNPGTVGKVLPNTRVKVVDVQSGVNLGAGEEGELCVKGPQVMKGYHNRQEATDDMIRDGWLHTGDIGMFNDDGAFTITDRLKELIKYKGYQVPPAELEGVLLTHPDIQDAAVIGVPDEVAGELPRAYVVLKADKTTTEDDIKLYVAEIVSQHKKLRGGVHFIKEIPKSASGKILRRKLKELI